jgi:hypothetical protein
MKVVGVFVRFFVRRFTGTERGVPVGAVVTSISSSVVGHYQTMKHVPCVHTQARKE